ncbi:MAG: phage major capsid protein, partial [Clostridia bacterium]|nr:phage major capsid protein [Clostridia bacterium]
MAKIKQSDANIWGKDIIKLAPFGINGGIGAGTETGALPTAAGNNYVQFKTSLKNLFGRIEISDKAIRASASSAGAFVNLLAEEMEGLVKASSFNLGRMIYGDGTGALATVASATGTAVVVDDTRNLIEGMVVDIFNVDAAVITGARIVFVDRITKTVSMDKTVETATAGAKLYVQGSKDNEITGLEAIFGTGDLYGLSRTNYPWLNPYVNNESVSMDDVTLQTTIDAI